MKSSSCGNEFTIRGWHLTANSGGWHSTRFERLIRVGTENRSGHRSSGWRSTRGGEFVQSMHDAPFWLYQDEFGFFWKIPCFVDPIRDRFRFVLIEGGLDAWTLRFPKTKKASKHPSFYKPVIAGEHPTPGNRGFFCKRRDRTRNPDFKKRTRPPGFPSPLAVNLVTWPPRGSRFGIDHLSRLASGSQVPPAETDRVKKLPG